MLFYEIISWIIVMWYCDIVLWDWKSASGPHRLPSARLGDEGELLWGHDAPARDDQGQEAQGKQREKGFNYLTILQFMFFFTGGKDQGHGSGTKAEKRVLWKSTTPSLTKKTWYSKCTEQYHYHNISLSDESHACKCVRPKVREREKESETYLQ